MGRYFGTDGIRGVAGVSPLSSIDVRKFGLAAGAVLSGKFPGEKLRVIAVRDTRQSGPWILDSLSSGLQQQGVDVYDAGVLSTPSVAYLVRAHRFHAGVVISASHNPPQFNGIKFFNSSGTKWPDPWEAEIEKRFDSGRFELRRRTKPVSTGRRVEAGAFREDYEEFLKNTLPGDLDFSGLRVALDCSHGANYITAPDLLRELKAKIYLVGDHPNGRNINVRCGSQHTSRLRSVVLQKKCHIGVAFDGDGDRVIMVDDTGSVVDGDQLIALLAKDLLAKRELDGKTVVITVMANLGLRNALKRLGIKIIEVAVGDRHVTEAMRKHGAVLGGEQSGHIVLARYLPSGDGLLTALHVLSILRKARVRFSNLAGAMTRYPQILLNVPVREKIPLDRISGMTKKIHQIEKTLGQNGRLLVRYSGTEPLLRIMLEGPHKKDIKRYADELAQTVLNGFR